MKQAIITRISNDFTFLAIMKIPHFLDSIELSTLSSRVHTLRTYRGEGWQGFVKRDDELSFGVSGSKARKYASLLPYLEKEGIVEVAVIGGAFSNHVLGICQRLIEKGIIPTLFLRGDVTAALKGNFLLTSLLVPSHAIRWISRQDWSNVELLASGYVEQQRQRGIKSFVLPEGAAAEESLAGALTLGWDILNNENTIAHSFDHVFVDSGTALSAIGLLLYFGWAKRPSHLHIVQVAGDSEYFESQLVRFKKAFEALLGERIESLPAYSLYQPMKSRSFGTVNKAVLDTVREIACNEGFFVDPIYSAKLFAEARKIVAERGLKGNVLLVHSGGGLALSGFQDRLAVGKKG